MHSNLTVLFLGLPRELDRFYRSIDELNKLNIVSKIIYSTWNGRLSDGLHKKLLAKGVTVLLNDEPSDIGKNSIIAQNKSLEFGLELCNENDIVLRTRTDVYISNQLLKDVLIKYENSNVKNSKVFDKKIWIPTFEITKPFYMDDAIFLGKCKDLKYLTKFDMSWNLAMDGGGDTHVRKFIHPFIKIYPQLLSYKDKLIDGGPNSLYIAPNSKERFKLLRERLNESDYLDYLTIYYYVLNKYFLIYCDESGYIQKQPYCKRSTKFNLNEFSSNFKSPTGPFNGIWCHDSKWISNLINGEFNDELANKILKRVENINE